MKLRSLVFAGAAAAALAAPSGALATGHDTSVTLSAGTLTFATAFTAGDFPTTPLNGLVQNVSADVAAWSVNDARGSLLPWNVKVRATQFTTGGTSPKTLPNGSMSYVALDPADIAAGAGQSLSLSPVGLAATAIDNSSGTNDQLIVQSLAAGSPGKWDFAAKTGGLTLVIPPTAEVGTYTSTITTTLASGLT